jgi:hypothetical protein
LLRALLVLTAFTVAWLTSASARADEATAPVMSMMSMMSTGLPSAPMTRASSAALASRAPSSLPSPSALPVIGKAPLCDPRGAITFAAAPQMQEVEVTLDTGMTAEDCLASSYRESYRAAPGRAPLPIDALRASSDAAVLTAVAEPAACARELTPAPVASRSCSRPGFRSTVDRPPRA